MTHQAWLPNGYGVLSGLRDQISGFSLVLSFHQIWVLSVWDCFCQSLNWVSWVWVVIRVLDCVFLVWVPAGFWLGLECICQGSGLWVWVCVGVLVCVWCVWAVSGRLGSCHFSGLSLLGLGSCQGSELWECGSHLSVMPVCLLLVLKLPVFMYSTDDWLITQPWDPESFQS